MHERARVLRLLIVLLVTWIVLDFALAVEGAFDFNTDKSLVWSWTTVAPTPALPSLPLASREAVPETATQRPAMTAARALRVPQPHMVPRFRLASATDPGVALDDH